MWLVQQIIPFWQIGRTMRSAPLKSNAFCLDPRATIDPPSTSRTAAPTGALPQIALRS